MREVTPETAVAYLRETNRVPRECSLKASALGWGVSNVVIRVDIEGQPPIVLKQSRERLRTQALWVSQLDRIWIEREALELLGSILPRGTVPEVLFADEANYLLAMSCAQDDSVVWKERLLAGEADPAVARLAGEVLGRIHAETLDHPRLKGRLAGTKVFDELRIDPFYRTVARAHPDLEPRLQALTESLLHPATRMFVHADFSPKNILAHSGGLTLVDFETAHAGDPAFDLGFFLSHLLLKAFRAAPAQGPYLALIDQFCAAYHSSAGSKLPVDALLDRACGHVAGCALARVDGKSPVDYLDEPAQAAVRQFARQALAEHDLTWSELLAMSVRNMQQNHSSLESGHMLE